MYWWIVAVVVALIAAVFWILSYRDNWDGPFKFMFAMVATFAVVIMCGVFVSCMVCAPQEISVFESQREYLANHIAVDQIENAALTSKKIEMNEWLFGAQYSKEKWGGWSFYPDSILQLSPIE